MSDKIFVLCCTGFASAQKVTRMSYCGIDKTHLRVDCQYEVPAESPDVMCKFTQGERIIDTTDPEEEQDNAYKNKAKVRIYPGNICRLRYNNLSEGRTNFTCMVKQTETSKPKSASVEKSKLLLLTITNPTP